MRTALFGQTLLGGIVLQLNSNSTVPTTLPLVIIQGSSNPFKVSYIRVSRLEFVRYNYRVVISKKFVPDLFYLGLTGLLLCVVDSSPKALAHHLKLLDADDAKYNSYFWWRSFYSRKFNHHQSICDLCQKLNQDKTETSYRDMREWWVDQAKCSTATIISQDDMI